MTGTVSGAISDEQTIEGNSLATLTENYLVIPKDERHAHIIIPRSRIARIDTSTHPYSGLLAIAGAVLVLSAAAFSSAEGDGFGFPLAAIGLFVLIGYFMSRRAEVRLYLDSGLTEVLEGRVVDAENLVERIRNPSTTLVAPKSSLVERFRNLISARLVSVRHT